MTAGLLSKAARGELALTLPVGLVRDALDHVHKDPHQEVQDRLELVFTTFLQLRSESLVLGFLNAEDPAALRSKQVRLPMEQWRIRVNEVYPAYSSWETFERIQAMLLAGMVYCGECGHKLVVQCKGGTRYLCNFLRQKYRVPGCQHIPGDAVDPPMVQAFFQALSPVELDVYSRAVAAQQQATSQVSHAHHQHLERLRYEAALGSATVAARRPR